MLLRQHSPQTALGVTHRTPARGREDQHVSVVETHVLVVGSEPTGAAATAALSTYGVRNTVLTGYDRLTSSPRVYITNQRTLEVLRDLELKGQAAALVDVTVSGGGDVCGSGATPATRSPLGVGCPALPTGLRVRYRPTPRGRPGRRFRRSRPVV